MVPAYWGRRLPNFATTDSAGRRFEYHRDVTHGPTVLARGLDQEDVERLIAAIDGMATLLLIEALPGPPPAEHRYRELRDADGRIRAALFPDAKSGAEVLLADPAQRLIDRVAPDADGIRRLRNGLAILARAPGQERRATAPVMLLPNLLPAEQCRRLIAALEAGHREGTVAILGADGVARHVELPDRKRRRDLTLERNDPLYREVAAAFVERLMPELWKAWWIDRLRTEAFYVACYQSDRSDFFSAHRDNNLPGTANRRLAVSIELNDDYDGGGLVFPEYSDDRWRAPAGGGLVFSCSLMHEAVPVTAGRRYVLLAFLAAPPG